MINICGVCGRKILTGWLCPTCVKYVDELEKQKKLKENTTYYKIQIKSFSDASEIVGIASKCECNVKTHSDNYIVNAKSLLGLYSLDLSKPITLEVCGNVDDEIIDELNKYVIKDDE